MRTFRRFWAGLLAGLLLAAAPAAMAGKDDSPVTGALPDKIKLGIDSTSVNYDVSATNAVRIRFCDVQGNLGLPVNIHFCTAPSRPLKIAGHKTTAVKIDPPIAGEWRFEGDYVLAFTPKKPWKPETHYTVTLQPDLFPKQVHVRNPSYSFDSAPLYLTSKAMDYLQDPTDPNKKFVTARLVFNYAVDHASVQKGLSFAIEGVGKELPYTAGFDETGMNANVTVNVPSLAKDAQFMNMAVMKTIRVAGGDAMLEPHPGVVKDLAERVMIPSLYDYLQVSNIQAQVLKDAHYVPQRVLTLESNTPVSPKDIGRFLEIKLLPKDKPIPGLSPKKDYAWSSPDEVKPDLRASLPSVTFTPQQPAGEPALVNGLNFNSETGRYMLVTVKKGMPAPGGYELGRDDETIVQVPPMPREVKIMAEGALLSLSGEKTLSVLSLGLSKLHYQIGRVKEENLNHLISQTRGNFAHPKFLDEGSFNEANLSHIFRDERQLANVDPERPNYSSFDFSPYLKQAEGDKGLFFLTVSNAVDDTPADGSQARKHHRHGGSPNNGGDTSDKRFILITDLGIILKKNLDGTHEVFVQSIANGGPVAGVEIEVLGTNGEPVASGKTDGEGHAQLPSLEGMKDEKTPVAFVARKDGDLSFLPFERDDRELNYSKFDVSGIHPTEGMQAYLFTDRGIYRPGETAHLGLIVKAQDWSKTAAGLPLILEITNPRDQVVSKQTLQLTAEGLMAADYTSSETAATGVYNAALYLGRDNNEKGVELGSVPLRVEEFQPDRMKMSSNITQEGKPVAGLGWVKPNDLKADVTLMQLYGAPATKRRITAKLSITPGNFGFEKYKDYDFAASNSVDKTFNEPLAETVTDDQGKAAFPLNMVKYKDSTFRLTFFGEGFEPDSGRSVKTAKSVLVSPLDYVLGVKSDSNLSYINPKDARSISLIAVNATLAKIAVTDATVELKRVKDIQTLVKDNSGSFSYQSSTVETSLKIDPLSIPAEGLQYTLPTNEPGSYLLIYKNAGGTVLAREPFTVVGESNAAAGFTREASMKVTPDKEAYKAGDTVTLNIQSPYTGTGLITIETDRVHAWHWFTASSTSSVQTIAIPEGFEGKGFINVQFTRDLKSKEIFMSPLSFAVVPFTANIDVRDQKVELTVPKDAKPGDVVTVEYHSKQPGKIVLYAVDEGILLYAHYANPNPIDHFLMRRGLDVKTSQIMDLLLPEYSLLKALSEAGGDGYANDGKNLNPFKRKTQPPVAYWSGILGSGADDRKWTFTVPPYFNGGVRVLAVGVSTEAMGMTVAGVNVHGPLIVTPNLPLFAAPGDTFVATATVANNVKGSGKDAKVRLDIEPSSQLQVIDAPKDPLPIAEGAEQTVQIKLKATEALGSGELRLTAGLGGEHFTTSQTLSIRPPLPSMTSLISGFSKEMTDTVTQPRRIYPELADMHASVSSLPVSLIGGLREYLVTYPYGCTEQMTSQNFPNVVLYGDSELIQAFGWKPEAMETAIRVSFDRLRERQGQSGGWGMWNYYSDAHGFISAYVMHFLLEAKEKNLPVPEDVFDTGLRFMKASANEEPHSLEEAREKAYMIYLLTRAGEITTNYIPHLTTYLDSEYKDKWHNDLVAVYLAATYQQMQMQQEAAQLLDAFHLEAPVLYTTSWHEYAFYDSLTRYSQYVYLIAKHFPKRLDVMDKAVIYRVANFVGEGTYNTVSSSYAVMAINAYVHARKDALANVSMKATGVDGREEMLSVMGNVLKVAQLKEPVASLSFASDTPGFFYQIAMSGYDKILPAKPLEQGLEMTRVYLGSDGKPVTKVKLGDRVDVVITLRSGSDESIHNVAVVDLLPGGFELEPEPKAPPADAKPAEGEADGDQPADTPTEASTNAPAAKAADDDATDGADKLATWGPESTDRREDRIILYGVFSPEKQTYRYRMKASTRGTFIVPPPYAESMYDPALKVRGVAASVEVQ